MRTTLYVSIIAALLSYAVQNIWFMGTDVALMWTETTSSTEPQIDEPDMEVPEQSEDHEFHI